MSDGAELVMPDIQALMADLRALPQLMRSRVLKGAVATGCSVIRKEAVLQAPVFDGQVGKGHPPPGTLKRAIYQTRLVEECTPTLEAWKVDVRTGKKASATKRGKKTVNLDAFYARWVEYGHYTRAPKAAGKTRKQRRAAVESGAVQGAHYVLPRPFMRPALQLKAEIAIKAMEAYLAENLAAANDALRILQARGF